MPATAFPVERGLPPKAPRNVKYRDVRHIPGKYGLPIFGTLPEALVNPLAFGLRMVSRFGPVHRFYASGAWCVQLVGHEANELVLSDRQRIFSSYYGWQPVLGPYFGGGLLLMDFEEHLKDRRLIGSAFRGSALPAAVSSFSELVSKHMTGWTPGQFDWHRASSDLLRDNAAVVFMGLSPGERTNEIGSAFDGLRQCTTALLPPSIPVGKASRALVARDKVHALLVDEVNMRRGNGADDLLSKLANLEDAPGVYCSAAFCAKHMVFVLAAAHDTMVAALCSVAWHLSTNPDVQDRVAEELATFRGAQVLEARDQQLTPYTEAVMKECLRLNAPAPILWRRALDSFRIYGTEIPAGTMVAVNPLVTHRDPVAFPDPDRFDPARFQNSDREAVQRWSYIPFGGGAHACLGLHYGYALMRVVLSRVLDKHRFHVSPGYVPRWNYWPYVHPRNGLPIELRRV